MPPRGRGPSIRDVAAHAGVSHQTVSRVLNKPEKVRDATRERVQASIELLGFRRNMAARSLATSASMHIGVVTVQSGLFGPTQMSLAIAEESRRRGYWMVGMTAETDSDEELREASDHLMALGVDGVIVYAWSARALELAGRFAERVPTCIIAEGEVPDGMARARADNLGGSKMAVQHLVETGRKRIAHLAGPSNWLESAAREQGWRAAGGQSVCVEAGWHADDGYRAVDVLLHEDPETDAIFAANDHVAAGAMHRLMERGIRVPEDIAIVGFDDVDLAPHLPVPLASVRQPFTDVGRASVNLLFDVMQGRSPGDFQLSTEFVQRASAG